MHIQNLSVTMH